MKIRRNVSEKLVLRINEIYHDLIYDIYEETVPEIFKLEEDRWKKIAGNYLTSGSPSNILDIGTGSGFIPLIIMNYLKDGDVFICSDISQEMLKLAERNINSKLSSHSFNISFKYIKLDAKVPFTLPFENHSFDLITINSVLHHIKDYDFFLKEIDRILKTGGIVIIGHEPNEYFYKSKILYNNFRMFDLIFNPKDNISRLLKKINLYTPLKKMFYNLSPKKNEAFSHKLELNNIALKINQILLEERLIEKPLKYEEIGMLTDITATKGFKPDKLLPDCDLLHLDTYNHIYWVTMKHSKNFLIKILDNYLKKKFPKCGSIFLVVLKK